MKKNKSSGSSKSTASAEMPDDAVADNLIELAIDLREADAYATLPDDLKKKKSDFEKIIRKCLRQKKDSALNEALDRTYEEDGYAFDLLKANLEELSGTIVIRRDEGQDIEVNAFVVPMFVHTVGGLRIEQCFQDEEAFERLRDSFQKGQLESKKATVVLVSHAFHLNEIDRISYSQLHEMVHEAYDSVTRKKATAAPAIARSMSGWPANEFAPDDSAVELRFLLGFAVKTLDDPFYKVPEKEAAADRYFETRAQHFRQWAADNASLVKRCLVTDGREVEIDFLYQDLFYGGKATALSEYYMLQMMSELHQALDEHGVSPDAAKAVIGPTDVDDGMVLRVNLYSEADGALIVSSDKPIAVARDLQTEADDVHDALATLGVRSLSLAMRFDTDGQPVDVRPYTSQAGKD
ncbi:MAG TPA: DUF2863 family protein [Noviherbaspirillum sp.]|jgi:hypothetical protein|uniref:DUF2863 family protein n=1 Tax=Noviherbaspirillum sp. TaxID=1926288 RepID=UPI002DDD99CE|nr:DUF2863 family protein [Noviherbaspirillum sp.]HEV2611868.1 DUF2863 family protein [Noviherbaspirillum sp.]